MQSESPSPQYGQEKLWSALLISKLEILIKLEMI